MSAFGGKADIGNREASYRAMLDRYNILAEFGANHETAGIYCSYRRRGGNAVRS